MDVLLNPPDFHAFYISVISVTVFALALWEVIKKVSAIVSHFYKKKRGIDDAKQKIQKDLDSIFQSDEQQTELIEALLQSTKVLNNATKVQMRHSIVRIAEESLKRGVIGSYELQSLEELFQCYGDPNGLNGNSYVHNLMKKVRELDVDYTNGNPSKTFE